MPMINKFGMEKFQKMRERVAREIKPLLPVNTTNTFHLSKHYNQI
mgnify:CR=1 FL=1